METLERYNELLVERNKVVNLTAHRTIESSWENNVADSLLFIDAMPKTGRMLDLGSGGGSPAIPLKITNPALDVTMIDSVGKKVDFLNETVAALGLDNIRAIHTRIEDFAKTHREMFDVVTARAVAALPTLVEYALPLLRVGGVLMAYKGSNYSQEIESAKEALKVLGGNVREVLDKDNRVMLVIEKTKSTPPKYPRGKNLPRVAPL
ncbi:MAG: 16S rRNA (guanine(527)-N(7))-methyltransferase RsmG [Firmicutes bacterium]|nr:16S rRNA (guanine(527)-N(7))-methyltransferase RsmG [Bacillota bacterium]